MNEPDWLLQGAVPDAVTPPTDAASVMTSPPVTAPADEPEWLKQGAVPDAPQQVASAEPEWLKQGAVPDAHPQVASAEPDWLKQGAIPDTAPEARPQTPANEPAWLTQGAVPDQTHEEAPKVTFDSAPKDQELLKVIRDYYTKKGTQFRDNEDAFNQWASDMRWTDNNIVSAGKELYRSATEDPDQLKRMAYLHQYWSALPGAMSEGGAGVGAMIGDIGRGLLDPTILLGGPVGKGVEAIASKGVTWLGNRIIKSAVEGAVIGGVTTGAMNSMGQGTEMNLGNQDSFHPLDAGKAMGIGAVTGGVLGAGAGAFAKPGVKMTGDPVKDAAFSKFDPQAPQVGASLAGDLPNRFVTEFVDKNNPINVYQKELTGVETSAPGMKQAYKDAVTTGGNDPAQLPGIQFRELASTGARAEQTITHGPSLPPDVSGTHAYTVDPVSGDISGGAQFTPTGNKGLTDIIEPFSQNGEGEHLNLYIAALRDRANEVFYGGRGQPYMSRFRDTPGARDEWIAYGDARPEFQQAAKDLRGYSDDMLEYQRRSGLLNQADIDLMKAKIDADRGAGNGVFVPFDRNIDNSVSDGFGRGIVSPGANPVTQRLEAWDVAGSTFKPMDQSFQEYTARAIAAADRNRANLSLTDMILEGQNSGKLDANSVLEKVIQRPEEVAVTSQSVIDELTRQGMTVSGNVTPTDVITALGFKNSRLLPENMMLVYRDGVAEMYRVKDTELLKSLKIFGNDSGKILQAVSTGTKVYGRLITSNPVFVAKNMIRDSLSATVNSQFGQLPGVSILKGIADIVRDQQAFREMMFNGGGHATNVSNTLGTNMFRSSQGAFLKNSADFLHQNFLSKGLAGYQKLMELGEQGSRFAEYQLARKSGMSPTLSAFMSREVTTDFGVMGNNGYLRKYNAITTFFNAGAQGLSRSVRAIRDEPLRAGGLAAMTVIIPDVIGWAVNSELPDYQALPQGAKDTNYIIPIYKDTAAAEQWYKTGQGKPPEVERFIAIPKSYDYGPFGTMTTGVLEAIRKQSGMEAANAVYRSFIGMIPGFGVPTAVQPFYQLQTNKDWAGREITPTYMQGTDPLTQQTRGTSQWAIDTVHNVEQATRGWLGQGKRGIVPLTPIELDYFANYLFAGAAQMPYQTAKQLYDKSQESRTGVQPSNRGDQFDIDHPVSYMTRAFQIDTPIQGSQNMEKFYQLEQRAKAVSKNETSMTKSLMGVLGIRDFNAVDENKALLSFSPALQAVARDFSAMRQQMDQVRYMKNPNVPDAQLADWKRQQLDKIQQLMEVRARQTLEMIMKSNVSQALRSTPLGTPPAHTGIHFGRDMVGSALGMAH